MDSSREVWLKVFKKNEEVVTRQIAGEAILVPIRGKLADIQKIFALNPVAEYIWQQLDRDRNLGEIRDGILANFQVEQEEAEADLQEFIIELLEADLIVGGTQ